MTVQLSMLAGAGAQFFDNNGNPLSGGKLFTYLAGTTTPAATYTTSAGNVAHTNPIVLDSAGRVPSSGEIWLLDSVSYKFILKTSNDVTLGTYDNITGNSSGLLTQLSQPTGSSLIGYIEGSANSVATTVQAALRREVWVEDFLPANFNIVTDDAAPYIQAAINSGASQINIEDKTYLTDSPIYLDGGQALIGQGIEKTIIKKRTTTAGTGSNTARGGAVTDSYAVNAIIICRHPDNGFNYRTGLENLSLYSDGYIVDYAIYAPRMSQLCMKAVSTFQCRIGYYTHDSWLSTIISCVFNANTLRGPGGSSYGWPDATPSYGVWWADDGTGSATGTSAALIDCWARDCHYGWWFYGLQYSSMNSCAADNISFQAYRFHLTKMTINGSACENVVTKQNSAWSFESSNCTLNNCQAQAVVGGSAGTTAMLFISGANVTFNNCQFDNFTTANTAFNLVVQSGSSVVNNNSYFPSNGNSFISYNGGSQWTDYSVDTPYMTSESVSSSPRYFRGRVRDNQVQEKISKAVVSAGTVIATLTAAGGSFDRGVCEFTVSWSDLPFPTSVGISRFFVAVLKESTNYRENVSTVTSAYATNGGAGAPTFTLSRVGNVWSLTMTPQDGDCTVHTITAQMQDMTGITLALP